MHSYHMQLKVLLLDPACPPTIRVEIESEGWRAEIDHDYDVNVPRDVSLRLFEKRLIEFLDSFPVSTASLDLALSIYDHAARGAPHPLKTLCPGLW